MNNERRLNMSEEEARKRMRELLNLPKEDLLTQYLFLQQENQDLKNQQKEFMNWLEENWKTTKDIWYIKILNEYKEIIGEDK